MTHVAIKTFSKRVLHVRRRPYLHPPVGACESLSHDLQQWTRGHSSSNSSSRCRRSRRRPRLLVNHKLIIRLRRLRRFESRKPCVTATFTLYPPPITPHIYIDGFLTTFDTSRRTNIYTFRAPPSSSVSATTVRAVVRALDPVPATGYRCAAARKFLRVPRSLRHSRDTTDRNPVNRPLHPRHGSGFR